MTDTAVQQPLFDAPGAPLPSDRLADYDGSLVLIRPDRLTTVDTKFGASDVTVGYAVVLRGDGTIVNLPQTMVFWAGVQHRLLPSVGTGRWVGGRLVRGSARNEKAWDLEPVTSGSPAYNQLMMAFQDPNFANQAVPTSTETADEPF